MKRNHELRFTNWTRRGLRWFLKIVKRAILPPKWGL